MSVLPASSKIMSCSFPSVQEQGYRHGADVPLGELGYEERVALWSVRYLLGVPFITAKGQFFLRSFFWRLY